ncbi:YaiO family outer membrane beta-barrel protein [Solimonas sp. SE-A11]|uniref:YaiO family outer membrane beta-barrel protein n=1 Tax=Solimonas sp. SE-A11 TaxID=3054954 RepID=UPI00259CFEBF|nr:YaiO family outer membrane beta-barrel protein [Solimonas sp. SE-A11]MDM4769615.1 YaiO family outer membrane beta-barrel protein [Solimonas sp. SE-A11]
MDFSGIRRAGMALVLLPWAVLAADNEVGVGFSPSSLSDGYSSWQDIRAHWKHRLEKGSVELSMLQAHRFDEHDTQLLLGGSYPLSEDWSVNGQVGYTPDADVLAEQTYDIGLSRFIGEQWAVSAAANMATYPGDKVYGGEVSVEWMPKPFRVTAGLLYGSLEDAGHAWSQLVLLDYVYGADDEGAIGIGVITGEQPERITANQVAVSDADAMFVGGSHWVTPRWGFDYRFTQYRRELFYNRQELSLGVMMRF